MVHFDTTARRGLFRRYSFLIAGLAAAEPDPRAPHVPGGRAFRGQGEAAAPRGHPPRRCGRAL